ncbi:MAG: fructose-bisphosphatase class II family protein [Proteobacteria bacterium]|nr:fructose-bisphosphatase class II family protein [Pseudomonadota bacterium]
MDVNYGMEIVRATEIAALSAARLQGLGDVDSILNNTREAFYKTLNRLMINGTIRNDRFGHRPNTYKMPKTVGKGGPKMDVLAIALEGHNAAANGRNNAISCGVIAKEGGIRQVPNLSMFKIVVGQDAYGVVDIQQPPSINIKRVARALKKYTESVTVCILDHARHHRLIHEVQNSGARIKLVSEGEISGCLAAIMGKKVDIFMGYGFAPEGATVAAAIKCLGGYFEGKIFYENDRDKESASSKGIDDFDKIFKVEDLILTNEVAFAATGVTDGKFLEGIDLTSNGAVTHSFIARAESHTYRKLETRHFFDYKPVF